MLYWLLMMLVMLIIINNDKYQIVSANCIRCLVQTMLWFTLAEIQMTLWPHLSKRLASLEWGAPMRRPSMASLSLSLEAH